MDQDILSTLEQDFAIDSIKEEPKEETPQVVDVYDRDTKRDAEILAKTDVKGSSAAVIKAVEEAMKGNNPSIIAEYNIAKRKAQRLREKGDIERAGAVVREYMRTHYEPLVEMVANMVAPDELLNNKSALRKLDDFALVWPTMGSGSTFTASYIRARYKDLLGEYNPKSDDYVTGEMRRVNRLLDRGYTRDAWTIAKVIKKKIDKGQHLASEEDYDLLEKMEGYYGARA